MTLPNDMYPQYILNVEKFMCKENYQNQSFAAIPNSGAIHECHSNYLCLCYYDWIGDLLEKAENGQQYA